MLMYDFCNTIENDVKVHVMASVLISDYSLALSDFFLEISIPSFLM